jgi:hypothetical protein
MKTTSEFQCPPDAREAEKPAEYGNYRSYTLVFRSQGQFRLGSRHCRSAGEKPDGAQRADQSLMVLKKWNDRE